MWVWPAVGFAWGLALAIIVGPFLAMLGIIGAFIFADAENRALVVIGTVIGIAAGLGLVATLSDVSQASQLRFGP
jgi:flagellar motor component MotA